MNIIIEEDDDDEYIVEEDTEVPLQSPNHTTQNISTSSSSHDLPIQGLVYLQSNSAPKSATMDPTPKNGPLIPYLLALLDAPGSHLR